MHRADDIVLVSADAIETGERLRLRLLDSDRFSADDSMGVVEVDIPDLVEQAEFFTADQPPIRRVDQLTPERSGMRTSGQLEWSVRFCPLWAMPREELEKRVEEKMQARPGEPTEDDMVLPTWLKWINNYMDVPNWAEERAKRREETLAWFTGAREREELEASAAPHDELRSGILQVSRYGIHVLIPVPYTPVRRYVADSCPWLGADARSRG